MTTNNFDGHTPGPWEMADRWGSRDPGFAIYHKPKRGPRIIIGWANPERETDTDGELIAAAPTLLRERDNLRAEAQRLTKVLRTIEDLTHTTPADIYPHDYMELCDRVNEIAQSAIKGEQ